MGGGGVLSLGKQIIEGKVYKNPIPLKFQNYLLGNFLDATYDGSYFYSCLFTDFPNLYFTDFVLSVWENVSISFLGALGALILES